MLRTRFEADKAQIYRLLLEMGVWTQEMLRDAVVALSQQDIALVESILKRDDEVDRLEQEIEQKALLMLAIQQPVLATDLRTVSTALKVITDIERIGDNTVNIAKTARRMWADQVIYRPLFDVPRLHKIASHMLEETLDAYTRRDIEAAQRVIDKDDEADVLYKEAQRDLRDVIYGRASSNNPSAANDALAASYLLFVAHYLERICDHCVSIAERVLFVEGGVAPHQ